MGSDGLPWLPIGPPVRPMETHGNPWEPMAVHGAIHGSPGQPMGYPYYEMMYLARLGCLEEDVLDWHPD